MKTREYHVFGQNEHDHFVETVLRNSEVLTLSPDFSTISDSAYQLTKEKHFEIILLFSVVFISVCLFVSFYRNHYLDFLLMFSPKHLKGEGGLIFGLELTSLEVN